MTGSPVSRCGEKIVLCFPRRIAATSVARRPKVAPSASTTRQLRVTSLCFVAYGPASARSRGERREVLAPHQPRAGVPHRCDVQGSGDMELAAPLERIALGRVPDPIFICPPRRREPGVEVLRRRLERRDRDVLRQEGVYPPADRYSVQRARRPEVDHLSARMHPGVRAPRTGDSHRLVTHRGERFLELTLHRGRVVLHLEPRVVRSVVSHARLPVRRLRSLLPSPSSSSAPSPWPRTWRSFRPSPHPCSPRRAGAEAQAGGVASFPPPPRPFRPWAFRARAPAPSTSEAPSRPHAGRDG